MQIIMNLTKRILKIVNLKISTSLTLNQAVLKTLNPDIDSTDAMSPIEPISNQEIGKISEKFS